MNEMDQKLGHPIRVVVADDLREMRDAVARELGSDYAIVRRVSDGVALVECTRELEPDLLVTDISMPNLTGISALRRLRQLGIQTPAIIVSVYEDEEVVQEAQALGVRGFVLKSRLASDLRLAAREVLAGRTFVSKPLDKIGKHIV
jgi:two-component system nitrate/nitrite response regulator NarL